MNVARRPRPAPRPRHRLAARRRAKGYTQESLAAALTARRTDGDRRAVATSTVAAWEQGTATPRPWWRRPLADVLDVTLDKLDELLDDESIAATPDESPGARSSGGVEGQTATRLVAESAPPLMTGPPPAGDDEDVDRREFTAGALLAALVLPPTIRETLTAHPQDRPAISMRDVEAIRTYVEDSRQHEAAMGGGSMCDIATTLHDKVRAWLAVRSLTSDVRHALTVLVGDLGAWAGWLAFDTGRPELARRYLHDTILHARLVDHPAIEVRAMACMCLLLNRGGRPAESLQCAEAARRIAEPWATPRLRSLLHLRAASAYAWLGESGAFAHSLTSAEASLDSELVDDELAWTGFVTPAELIGLAGRSQLVLGRPGEAAAAFRSIAENPDPAHHRNVVYYTVQLAHATAQQGDTTGAAEIGLGTLPLVSALHSGRTRRALHQLRVQLNDHRTQPAVDNFAHAYDQAMSA